MLHAVFGMLNQIFKYMRRVIILRLSEIVYPYSKCICTVLTAETVATGEVNCLFNSAAFYIVHWDEPGLVLLGTLCRLVTMAV